MPRDFDIHVRHILRKLCDDVLDVRLGCNLSQNLQFKVLDVAWFIVLNEELFVFSFKDPVCTSHHEQMNM